MISWMQRHKKWLVITIWISTIAFVGAGFVGWGSYDYGSKGAAVALVGDREVSVEEYQREYSSLYEQYSRMFGEQFNQEMADKLKLKDAAYRLVIQKNLILSLADDLGLDVTEAEIAKQLLEIPAFKKDGKFDKETYIKVLHQNRTTPTAFEASIKRDILLQKVQSLFNIKADKNQIKNLNELLFVQDKVSIKVLKASDIKVEIKEEDLKKYWQENKNRYMSETLLKLATDEIPISIEKFSDEELQKHYKDFKSDYTKENGKLKSFEEAKNDIIKTLSEKKIKKDALKKYLALKKDKQKFDKEFELEESKLNFPQEELIKINQAVPGDILKPFLFEDKFVIIKVVNKILPKPLSYEKARKEALNSYKKILISKELNKLAKKELQDFKGVDLGYISRTSTDEIKGLNKQESNSFLNALFSSSKNKGKIELEDKVVLYKINDTKLAQYDSSKDKAIESTINNLINQELISNLIKNLENRYEVQSSIKLEE